MNISLTDILLTIFLVLIYKLLKKRGFNLKNVDNFTEDIIEENIVDDKLDISKLSVIKNNIKMNLTKNNNCFELDKDLTYKILRPNKNRIKIDDKIFNLKKIIFAKSRHIYNNKVKLEIQLHFTDSLKIIIPIIESKDKYLELFRIDHFDHYQSGKYLIKNLPKKIQGVNNKSIVFNIWFYPLVDFINSNSKLKKDNFGNIYTKPYLLNNNIINKINDILL